MNSTRVPATNPALNLGFTIFVLIMFLIFSGVLELMAFLAPVHPIFVLSGLALFAALVSGQFVKVLSSPIGKTITMFTVWFLICIPLSIWRGGSFHVLTEQWYKSFFFFLMTASVVTSVSQSRRIFNTIGHSVGLLAIIALALRGYDRDGRLGLFNTRYENANDLAWTLLLGLTFLSFIYSRGNRIQKIIVVILCAPILLALVKTGSRAGFIGAMMLVAFSYLQAPRRVRRKIVAGVPVLLIILLAITPAEIRSRYTTYFTAGLGASKLQQSAVASADARLGLLKDSIRITIRHPIFGVGPGNFPIAQNELALARGESRGYWRVTHDTFTQVSSEMGIPGLIIYIAFLYQCFKTLTSIVRTDFPGKDWQDLRSLARSLRASLVILVTVAVFDAYGFDINIPVVAGLACGLGFVAQRKRAALLRTAPTPQPSIPVSAESSLEPAWTAQSLA